MFEIGQKVIIKPSERINYFPPYDGVVSESVTHYYIVTFSDGTRCEMDEQDLESEDEFPSLERMVEILRNSGYKVEKL